MNSRQYRKLNKLIEQLENEADSVNMDSAEFEKLKRELIEEKGFTYEEYESYEEVEKPMKIEGVEMIKGDKGDSPTKEELIEIIEPLIPEPIPGKDGKDGKSIKGERGPIGKTFIALRGKPGEKGESVAGPAGKDADLRVVKEMIDSEITKASVSLFKEIGFKNKSLQERVLEPLRRLGMGLQAQIDALSNPVTIDLDSQVDGATTEFDLGRKVTAVLIVNNNGGLVRSTGWSLNSTKDKLTLLDYTPTNGEELEVVVMA